MRNVLSKLNQNKALQFKKKFELIQKVSNKEILEAAEITSTLFWSSNTINMHLKKIVFIQKLDGVAPLIADPPAMKLHG